MKKIKTKTGKTYTKKQICEAIAYWKKQLKRMDESTSIAFTPKEKSMLNSYFSNLYSEEGKIPVTEIIGAVKFKDDPTYGGHTDTNTTEYIEMTKAFGPPSAKWIADEFCEFATDGHGFNELVSAFKKLEDAGYMSIDPKTGIVTYDLDHIKMADNEWNDEVIID